jgi:hypothetical protein
MDVLRRSRALLVAVAVISLAEIGARALATQVAPPVTWDSPYTQDKAEQIVRVANRYGGAGTVFLGSSIVNAGIDPERFVAALPDSTVAYNAGLPGASAGTWRLWAADLVYPYLCPGLVVIGVTVRDVNDNAPGVASDATAYLRSRGRRVFVGEADPAEQAESAIDDLFALIRMRDLLRRPADVLRVLTGRPAEGWRVTRLTEFGRYYAFDDHTYRIDDDRRERLRTGAFRDFAVGGVEIGAVEGMIDDARRNGAAVVLLETPIMERDLVGLLPGGAADLVAFRSELDGLASRMGVPVLRFPDLVDRADLFADEYHLNGAGVSVVTDRLASSLGPAVAAAGPLGSCEGASAAVGNGGP